MNNNEPKLISLKRFCLRNITVLNVCLESLLISFTVSSSLYQPLSPSHHSHKKLRLNSIRPLAFLTTGVRFAAIGLLCVIQTTQQ